MVNVTTRSYDNLRSGSNNNETVFTPAKVASQGIKRLFSLNLTGDNRGCEAQPLLLDKVVMCDGLSHNILIQASMAGTVWVFDADFGTLLWVKRVGCPIDNSAALDEFLINDHWGITGTPVIDPASGILYCCAWASPDGTPAKAEFWLHALRISNGAAVAPPIDLSLVSYTPPNNLPTIKFTATARKQRTGLVLTEIAGVKTIFISFGSVSESLASARGWLIAVGVNPFIITATWCATAKLSGAGIWQGGAAPAADSAGNIYIITGNGAFDGVTDFGESFVKLKYTPPPPTATGVGMLTPIDWFSPFSDAGRVGEPQANPQITVTPEALIDSPSNSNDWNDQDLGSGGPNLIPSLGLVFGAGKDGILYVMAMNNMGKTKNTDFTNPADNYAKLKAPPIWYTFFPGFITAAPDKFTALNVLYGNVTHHLHGNSICYHSKLHGDMVFCWGENNNLRAWTVAANGKFTYQACSAELASPQSPGMPGGMLTLSANNGSGAIIWALVPTLNANAVISPAVLYAYDAENFVNFSDGSKQIKLLWRSDQWGLTFSHPKFNLPVVANGKLFIPTYDDRIDVYALA